MFSFMECSSNVGKEGVIYKQQEESNVNGYRTKSISLKSSNTDYVISSVHINFLAHIISQLKTDLMK